MKLKLNHKCKLCNTDIFLGDSMASKGKIFYHTECLLKSKEEEILGREKSMRCLKCGVSLVKEIMGNKIHLHLCEKCRVYELNRMTKEILK